MPRFSLKQYQPRVLIAMAIYTVFIMFVWPLVSKTTSLPLKVLLAVAPTVPVLYVIAQMARLIRNSDELERHTHLVALSTATAVVSALTFVAGFLVTAGVVKLDGSSLLWVYPAMVFCYGLVRWRLIRSYGGSMYCDEELSIKPYVFLMLFGVVLLFAGVPLTGHVNERELGFVYGTGGAFIVCGLLFMAVHWYKRKYRSE
ncbi:hypothetical protein [Dyella acidisoli]|uniref:Uncharacterized protein n=1 Tax=Dyella acidisoli TaxID=1867834 RepID=A0ABQ5XSG0_9GAMM|nr:hypothetical protein [Dyella acidisoli]GLQ93923.1 hypothetical protein GCM10007901_28740 [Dyella acidisoli]